MREREKVERESEREIWKKRERGEVERESERERWKMRERGEVERETERERERDHRPTQLSKTPKGTLTPSFFLSSLVHSPHQDRVVVAKCCCRTKVALIIEEIEGTGDRGQGTGDVEEKKKKKKNEQVMNVSVLVEDGGEKSESAGQEKGKWDGGEEYE